MDITADTPELAYKSALAIMDCHGEYSQNVFASMVLDNINGPTINTTPNGASSRSRILTLSAPIGGALMIVLLVMMSIQADTVQTPEGAKHQVDGKLLTTVYHERKNRTLRSLMNRKKSSLLITDPTISFYYTETIHQLRVFIERAHEKQGRQVFVVTSCNENEGKSTIAANIALSLSQKHRRVLLLDADLRKPAQNLVFEHPVEHGRDFGTLMTRGFTDQSLKDAVVHLEHCNLSVLFAESVRRQKAETFSPDSFRPILEALRKQYSYIIVDTPPLGIFAAIWLVEYAKRGSKLVKVVRITTETLQGIPSIVYGLFGMLFFVMQLKWGYSLIAGAFTLAIMVLPVIMRTTEEALLAVPDSYREGSFGLGAGKLRTVFTIVLPSAMPGILSGVILATGRIVGETAALIYTASTVAAVPASVFSSTRTLATHMYLLSNEGLHINETYGTAVVLLILVLLINSLSSFIAGRLAKK